jgi:hypothetical protein
VQSYPMISNARALVPVGTWSDIPWFQGYATRETLVYEEEPQNTGNGEYYIQTITGFAPGDRPELIDLMESMPYTKYLTLIKDPLAKLRLVGTPIMPLTFSAKFSTGGLRSDQKGFFFKFTGESLKRAPAYLQ